MPQVYRINQGEKVSVFVSDIVWAKIQKRPNVFGKKWELIPPAYKKVEELILNDDIAEVKPPKGQSTKVDDDISDVKPEKLFEYTEEKYREDLKSARLLLNAGNKKDALFMYQRTFKFKKSPYVKKQIKLLS